MDARDRRIIMRAALRLLLGVLQIAGATASLFLLVDTGLSAASVVAVAVTCSLTATSIVWRSRVRGRSDS